MPTHETILRAEADVVLTQVDTLTHDGGRISLHYRISADAAQPPRTTTDRALAESAFYAAVKKRSGTA